MKIAGAALSSLVPAFAFLLEGVTGAGRDAHESLRQGRENLLVSSIQRRKADAVTRYDVCHKTDEVDPNGDPIYQLIRIPEPGYDAHQAHGDAYVGFDVPDMDGYVFDESCNVVEQQATCCPCFGDDLADILSSDGSASPEYYLITEEAGFDEFTLLLVDIPDSGYPQFGAISTVPTEGTPECYADSQNPPLAETLTIGEPLEITYEQHTCCSQLLHEVYDILCVPGLNCLPA